MILENFRKKTIAFEVSTREKDYLQFLYTDQKKKLHLFIGIIYVHPNLTVGAAGD
jgi:hypothetical protein